MDSQRQLLFPSITTPPYFASAFAFCTGVLTLGKFLVQHALSKDTVSESVDRAMDRALPSNGDVLPGISIRNGPVQEVDIPMPDANGVEVGGGPVKRKARESLNRPSYAEPETSEDDNKPLVWRAAVSS